MRSVALCEIEAFPIANLVSKMEAGLMESAPIWTDLKTFPWESFRDRVDILTGGYPCQPFSAAGKRAGKEDQRHLWPWIADGIRILRPRACFFENVEGHISLGLSSVISDLEELGYKVSWGIFSAREVGAPHQRKRVFILANLKCAGLERLYNWHTPSEQTEFVGADSRASGHRSAWPSRPGEPQHGWEPPRVVGNTKSKRAGQRSELRSEECGSRGALPWGVEQSGEVGGVSNASHNGLEIDSECAIQPTEGRGRNGNAGRVCSREAMGNTESANGRSITGDHRGQQGSLGEQEQVESGGGDCGALRESNGQTEPPLGGNPDGPASGLGYAELRVSCDNRTDELRLLGNGVVPATAERAFRTLIKELL